VLLNCGCDRSRLLVICQAGQPDQENPARDTALPEDQLTEVLVSGDEQSILAVAMSSTSSSELLGFSSAS
jgi:hypothetical protein